MPLTVCAAAVALVMTMPDTDAVWVMELLALPMVRSRTVLLVMVFVPPDTKMPLISPNTSGISFNVELVKFATVFPEMITVPVPELRMP